MPKLLFYNGLRSKLVGAAGLEPATLCLEGRCSIHLSYAPIFSNQYLTLVQRDESCSVLFKIT